MAVIRVLRGFGFARAALLDDHDGAEFYFFVPGHELTIQSEREASIAVSRELPRRKASVGPESIAEGVPKVPVYVDRPASEDPIVPAPGSFEAALPDGAERSSVIATLKSLGFTTAELVTPSDQWVYTILVPARELADLGEVRASIALMEVLLNRKVRVLPAPSVQGADTLPVF